MAPKVSSRNSEDMVSILKDFCTNITNVIKNGFERHLDVLQHEIFEMRKEQEKDKNKIQALERDNEELKHDLSYLNGELQVMIEKMDQMEQKERRNDLIFDNVENFPVSGSGEELQVLVNKTLMGEVITDSDIKSTRVFRKQKSDKTTIIATFKSLSIKKAILGQKKLFMKKNVFVKENLTPARFELLKLTRIYAQENGFKFAWSKDGNVFIRKNESSPVIAVKNKSTLQRL